MASKDWAMKKSDMKMSTKKQPAMTKKDRMAAMLMAAKKGK